MDQRVYTLTRWACELLENHIMFVCFHYHVRALPHILENTYCFKKTKTHTHAHTHVCSQTPVITNALFKREYNIAKDVNKQLYLLFERSILSYNV